MWCSEIFGTANFFQPCKLAGIVNSLTSPRPAMPDTSERQLRNLLFGLEASHDEEKRALAHVLHADLGASLTALNMHLAILFRQIPQDERLLERVAAIKGLGADIAKSTRQMEASLRAAKLDSFGLKATLDDMASQFTADTGIACVASLPDEDLSYPQHIDLALYRLVREALDNVARHAGASRVDIVLDDNEDEIMLSVRDDGKGLPADDMLWNKGRGLMLLRERAAWLGGELRIRNQAGKGTSIAFMLSKADPG